MKKKEIKKVNPNVLVKEDFYKLLLIFEQAFFFKKKVQANIIGRKNTRFFFLRTADTLLLR